MKSKTNLACSLFFAAGFAVADEVRKFAINADDWSEGDVPKEVFVVDGTIRVASKDGNKAIMVDPQPITDASAQLGDSASGSSSIQARVFATKKGRSYPRFGVSLHGMSGFRLIVNVAKKQVELVRQDEVVATAPVTWTSDTWTMVKLSATKRGEGDWLVTGKAWPADMDEPRENQLSHKDKTLKGQGKAAIWGSPFSEMPIYFDDIKIEVTLAAKN
jgi:hypothetical protein